MRHLRIIGLALIATFALSAIVAASASAETLPTIYECGKAPKNAQKKYLGKYTNSTCTKEATKEQIEIGKENKFEIEVWGTELNKKPKVFKGAGGVANLEIQGLAGVAAPKAPTQASSRGRKPPVKSSSNSPAANSKVKPALTPKLPVKSRPSRCRGSSGTSPAKARKRPSWASG